MPRASTLERPLSQVTLVTLAFGPEGTPQSMNAWAAESSSSCRRVRGQSSLTEDREILEKRESHRGGEPPDLPVEATQIFKPRTCRGDTRSLGEKPAA